MPAAAVPDRRANGSFVYVVKEGAKVAVQPVTLGVADGGVVEVKSGRRGRRPGRHRRRRPPARRRCDQDRRQQADFRSGRAAEAPATRWGWRGGGEARLGPGEGRERRARKRPDAEITLSATALRPKERRPRAMNPSEIFILRPVATTLLMVAILLAGMFAYNFLPLSALPEVDYRRFRFRPFIPAPVRRS